MGLIGAFSCPVAKGREGPCACLEALWVLDRPGMEVRLAQGLLGPYCSPTMGLGLRSLAAEM